MPTLLMKDFFKIDTHKKTPKYIQIIEAVTNAIKQGKLKKGDAVFSINELSDEFLLSRDTVQKAYNLLRKKGVITAVKGKGFYIIGSWVLNLFINFFINSTVQYSKQKDIIYVYIIFSKVMIFLLLVIEIQS